VEREALSPLSIQSQYSVNSLEIRERWCLRKPFPSTVHLTPRRSPRKIERGATFFNSAEAPTSTLQHINTSTQPLTPQHIFAFCQIFSKFALLLTENGIKTALKRRKLANVARAAMKNADVA
jgi:hypothetical protein